MMISSSAVRCAGKLGGRGGACILVTSFGHQPMEVMQIKGRHRLEEKKAACVLCLVIFQALNVLL